MTIQQNKKKVPISMYDKTSFCYNDYINTWLNVLSLNF